jgi:hypothetical protein
LKLGDPEEKTPLKDLGIWLELVECLEPLFLLGESLSVSFVVTGHRAGRKVRVESDPAVGR